MNRKKRAFNVVGAILLALGLWQSVAAVAGHGRSGAGRLFFDEARVEELVATGVDMMGPLAQACADEAVAGSFDSSSVKKFDAWCQSVGEFAEGRDVDSAVSLLRRSNRHFARLADRLFVVGGELARRSLVMQESYCALKPVLEETANHRAGAAMSQFLVGFFLAGVGLVLLALARRQQAL